MINFENNKTEEKLTVVATTRSTVYEFVYLKSYLTSKDVVTIIEEVKEDVKCGVAKRFQSKIVNHVVSSVKDYLRK